MAAAPFDGLEKQPGLRAWRVEQFQLVSLPTPDGKFYTGDSYVVLNSYKDSTGTLKHNIHFWLGAETSTDEAGSAALYATKLDDYLDGVGVQYREVQGSESPEFLKLFKRLTILPGGKASGFTSVPASISEPRLIEVHQAAGGVRVAPVACSASSLNSGDAFILDVGETVFLWQGSGCTAKEKSRALDVATGIRDEDHAGNSKVVVLEETDRSSDDAAAFYSALGVQDPAGLSIAADTGADTSSLFEAPQLFKVDGTSFELVSSDKLSRSMLTSDSAYILRTGGGVWVWLGSSLPQEQKAGAAEKAAAFLSSQGLPAGTPVKIAKQRLETTLFKLSFPDWPSDEMAEYVRNSKEPQEDGEGDAEVAAAKQERTLASMVAPPEPTEAERVMFGDNGKLKMWRVSNSHLEALPQEQVGHLYSDKAYVLLYTYPSPPAGDGAVIYFWIGRLASNEDAGAAALLATNMHNEQFKGASTLVRVPQGAEPAHLAQALKGALVVHASSTAKAGSSRLYQVKGENSSALLAAEVPAAASSLNSGDCFIVTVKNSTYVWQGSCSLPEEQEATKVLAKALQPKKGSAPETITEGAEPDAFWEALGGKAEYPKFKVSATPRVEPRLFQLSLAKAGAVNVQQLPNFSQDDLEDEDVMLLDTHNQLFLWLGSRSPEEERTAAAVLALKYLEAASKVDGRSLDLPVTQVQAGHEPPIFTCHFQGWDSTRKAAFVDPYEQKLAALAKQQSTDLKQDDAEPDAKSAARLKALEALEAAEAAQAKQLAGAADDEDEAAPAPAVQLHAAPPKEAAPADADANGDSNGHAAATEAEPVPEEPTVSVNELRKRLSEKGAPEEPAPLPRPTARKSSFTAKDRPVMPPEEKEAAAPEPPAIVAHSEHDTKNTANIAQILQEGSFKLVPPDAVLPYEELVRMRLEDGIDATRREDYLSEDEFSKVFGMSRSDFKKLPAWKQQQAKKKANLF